MITNHSCQTSVPWEELNDLILENGNIRVQRDFCVHFAKAVKRLLPYDQARIYFYNDNHKVCDTVLFGADSLWMDMYLEYYSTLEGGRYSVKGGFSKNIGVTQRSFDWSKPCRDVFIAEYIIPLQIRCSLSFPLHDAMNTVKALCTFERTTRSGYTPEEVAIMGIMQAHLDNLHKNLLLMPELEQKSLGLGDIDKLLTRREREIAQLIRRGVMPSSIARILVISPATVYKHIANIYKKLNISSKSELILLMAK